jgi:ATPase subunit of ABC transporter with duplicated ATPase domains
MIVLDSVAMSYGSRVLFENVNVSFNGGNRYGLTGPNGAGKSTLLKIIMGQKEPTTGYIKLPKRIGFLRQDIEHFKNFKVLDVVIMGNKKLYDALEEREKLYDVEMTNEVGMRLGDLEEIVAEEDGYSAEADAEVLLIGMGIPLEFHQNRMHEIPLDLQFRILLCQAIFGGGSGALILDEPTNHLDMQSIRWLESFLMNYQGTLIVVSHDRHFLNAVTTHIADIDYQTVIIYPGNYDDMVLAKMAVRDRADHEAKSNEKKIAKLQEFVQKFGAGTRASQVQSRKKEIDRLQPQDLKKSNIQRPYVAFTSTEQQPGRIVLKGEHLSKVYESDKIIIKNFDFEIHRGDKIGVIGNNGIGKTTLLKLLAGVLEPTKGEVTLGHQAKLAYFPQNHADLVNKSDKTPIFDWLRSRRDGVYDQEIRGALGRMLFPGDDAFKLVSSLSGGETARLILAGMMLQEHNILVLDEPNNHLDLEAVSALAQGLKAYKGTVIVASHDQDLIDEVAEKLIVFDDKGHCKLFDGKLAEYSKTH